MKIRQIRFRNINSFYGEHPPIRFTDGLLASTGLFVISGPTGAGKSTLLDVITLALFNRIPRIAGIISNTAILSEGLLVNQQALQEPNTAAYAEVEYEVAGQAYRSRWSIKKNRNGNWNNYEMEVAQLVEGQPEGKLFPIRTLAEFPKKNEELIGLTYEQFIRSIVLAQGAFDQFLKARAAERSKMLEKITGTEIYRQLSQRAYAEAKQFDSKLDLARQTVSLINTLDDEAVDSLKKQQKAIDADLKELDGTIDHYETEQHLLRQIREADGNLAALSTRRGQLADQQLDFATERNRLERHALVADMTAELTTLRNLDVQNEALTRQKSDSTNSLQAAAADLQKLLHAASTLVKKPDLEENTIEAAINEFRERVLSLDRDILIERENLKRPLATAQQLIRSAGSAWRQLNLDQIESALTQVRTGQQSVAKDLLGLVDTYPTITAETLQHELSQLAERTMAYSQLVSLLDDQQKRLAEGLELKARAENIERSVAEKAAVARALEIELHQIDGVRLTLEQEQRRIETEANLDELRKGLTAGAPCPLCGSLSHPYAQHYIQQTGEVALKLRIATSDWEKKRQEFDLAQRAFIGAQAEQITDNKHRNQLREDYKERKAELGRKLTAVALDTEIQPTELKSMIKLLDIQRQDFNQLQTLWHQRDLLDRLADELELIQRGTKRSEEHTKIRNDLFSGADIRRECDDVINRFTTIKQRIGTQQTLVQKATDEQRRCQEQLTELQTRLTPTLHDRGFSDLPTARTCLLDTTEARRLQEQQNRLQRAAEDIARRMDEETTKRNQAQASRRETNTLDEVENHLKALKDRQRQTIESIGSVKKQLEQDQGERKRQQKMRKALTDLEQKAQPWRELAKLIGSAKGDEFSKFAQGLTLSQLIGLANRRLRELTDRYLILKPRDGQEELYVVDQYQGSAERSVSSLSGGETFTLSLSLALGLSDLASQNVQINSLFIDEGFGTLDPESLDTAIVMLERLQHDSQKTIGIISHRHEIKERISVQIQVDKGTDGNSKLNVVGG